MKPSTRESQPSACKLDAPNSLPVESPFWLLATGCWLLLLDRYRNQLIALLDLVDDIFPLDGLSKNGMFSVQPRRFHVGDEKLASVGIRTGIGHGKRAWRVLVGVPFGLVFELVAGTSAAGAGRIAALHHEIRNHSMKNGTVIELLFGQEYEIIHRFRGVRGKQFANNLAAGRLKRRGVLFGWIN